MILIARAGFGIVWNHKFDPKIRRILLGTWMVSFIVFAATVTFGARNFAFHGSTTSFLYNGPIDRDSPLLIEVDKMDSDLFDDRVQLNFGHSRLDNGKLYVARGVHFRIRPSEDLNLYVSAIDKSRGSSPRKAKKNTAEFQNQASIEENKIKIDEYYSIPRKSRFRGQYRTIEMQIPVGQDVVLKGSSSPFNRNDFNGKSPHNIKNWTMTSEGLVEKI